MRSALLAALLPLTACRTLGPPPPALIRALETAPPMPEAVRERATLRVDSPRLSGVFEAVLVARPGSAARARLQLFPDVGGKVLDLVATPRRIAGTFPPTGESFEAALPPAGAAPRHLLFFMGVTLLELFTPVTPGRVRGARPDCDAWEVELEPVVAGGEVRAWIDPAGAVTRRAFRYHGVSWQETAGRIEGGAFRMTAEGRSRGTPSALPDALFEARPHR